MKIISMRASDLKLKNYIRILYTTFIGLICGIMLGYGIEPFYGISGIIFGISLCIGVAFFIALIYPRLERHLEKKKQEDVKYNRN